MIITKIVTIIKKIIGKEKIQKDINENNKNNKNNINVGARKFNKIYNQSFFKFRFGNIFYVVIISTLFFSIFASSNNASENETFDAFDGNTDIPIAKYTRITSPFGYRVNPFNGKTGSFHPGVDVGTWEGTPLIAIMDGKVTNSSFKGGFGYCIEIDVGNNLIIQYGHSHPDYMPKLGSLVKKGDIVGRVGPKYVAGSPYKDSTGRGTNGLTTAPHLHFGIRKNGKYINPMYMLKGIR